MPCVANLVRSASPYGEARSERGGSARWLAQLDSELVARARDSVLSLRPRRHRYLRRRRHRRRHTAAAAVAEPSE